MLVEDLKILERWREYHQKLTNEDKPIECRNEQQMEDGITKITSVEIGIALRNMKNGKATGSDDLPLEL